MAADRPTTGSASHLTYYAFEETAPRTCHGCGWTATGAEADKNSFDELFDLRCPRCERLLVIVSYPTIEETKAEAKRGN